MVAIIVSTHGKFSKEIVKSAEMIFGKQENIEYITFEPGENPDDLVEKYKEAIKTLNSEDGVLFMVDLFGGSPYNAASRLAITNENMDIVTGVNLPMLLEVFGARSFSTFDELIKVSTEAGISAIKVFKQEISSIEEEEL